MGKCKPCYTDYQRKFRRTNGYKYNQAWYKRSGIRFKRKGITKERYELLLLNQEGVCAICHEGETMVVRGRQRPLHIDTDHLTGKVRGLLCSACNTGLGKFEDDPIRLQEAIRYLEDIYVRTTG